MKSAAVTPAIPLPITTTLAIEWSNSLGSSFPCSPGSGFRAMATGPDMRRAQQAIRVLPAKPNRRSVFNSSSSGGDKQLAPSRTAIGSAPHTPIRQPASIACPLRSATSSKERPDFRANHFTFGLEPYLDLVCRRRLVLFLFFGPFFFLP